MFCWLEPRHQAEVAAATWTKIRLPRQRARYDAATPLVERTEVSEHWEDREKYCGWRLLWYASSLMPPGSPAGASHSTLHGVINLSLCPDLSRSTGSTREDTYHVQLTVGLHRCKVYLKVWFLGRCP